MSVCTPESPSSSDNSPFDLATLRLFAHGSRIESQHFCSFAQCQEPIANPRPSLLQFPFRSTALQSLDPAIAASYSVSVAKNAKNPICLLAFFAPVEFAHLTLRPRVSLAAPRPLMACVQA